MVGKATGRHWVVIETGANQAYIFGTNKQMINVGASEQVWRVGKVWVGDVVTSLPQGRAEPVVTASGKALLLVDTPATGRELISAVTARALKEAPDLEVWGIVDPQPVTDDDDVGAALARAYRLHAAWRSRRPATALRHPTLPFTQRCHFTGRPAVSFLPDDDREVPVSAGAKAAADRRNDGRRRMARLVGERALVAPDRLNDGVRHGGWIAVLHADGNGIGEVFRTLAEVYSGDEFLARLDGFSQALDEVTKAAVSDAVKELERRHPDREEWLLPLIVGGDDVTAILDGRLAFDFAVTFLRSFADRSAQDAEVSQVLRRLARHRAAAVGADGGGLTASVGIAYVKPHYTFSDAYRLADELCASAKAVKHHAPGCGALDFHVLHDSVGLPLARLRASLQVDDGGRPLRLWAGPVVVPADEGDPGEWARRRDVRHLLDLMAKLRPDPPTGDSPSRQAAASPSPADGQSAKPRGPVLNRTSLHKLRQALMYGGAEIDRAREQVEVWSSGDDDHTSVRELLDTHLRVPEPGGAGAFSRIPGAMDLLDMAVGATADRELAVTGA